MASATSPAHALSTNAVPTRSYLRLPVNAVDGFPQALRLAFGGRAYAVSFYVNIPEEQLATPPDHVYDLFADEGLTPKLDDIAAERLLRTDAFANPDAFMVMRVEREGDAGPEVIFRRKLTRGVEYVAAELAFTFREIKVARGNLNGVGAFGSVVVGGVATRWAS
jgi:hypothetical protein